MKKNFIFNLFLVFIVFFLFSIQAFAKTENNVVSKIVIENTAKNNYTFNLLFNDTYTGNAFLQKRENGSYYVFLPDTITKGKTPKVIFKNKSDKSKINLIIEEKPFIKNKKNSNYVRISVDMADDYTIKLVAGLAAEYNTGLITLKNINYGNIIILVCLAGALFLVGKIYSRCKEDEKNYYRPSRSYAHLKAQTEYLEEMRRNADERVEKEINTRTNIKRNLKQADKNSFDCFELPFAEDIESSNNYEFHSTLNQASKLLKEKPSLVKLRHTNPITRTNSTDVSGLQMPAVEDIMPKKKKQTINIETEKPTQAELLSVLNITPNKGFYLTTVDDTLALFGFINENVFLFKKFTDLSQINLQARYYDRNGNNDIYIVRLDDYKAMIEISDTSMRELAKI